MNKRLHEAIEAMVDGGTLYVYVETENWKPQWPEVGSGAIVYDGPPLPISPKIVRGLQCRAGEHWYHGRWPEQTCQKWQAKLAGRDVLWLAPRVVPSHA